MTGNLLERYKQHQDTELPKETSACSCTQNFVLYSEIYVISYQDSLFFPHKQTVREKMQLLEYTSSAEGQDKENRKILESLTKSGFAQCPFRAAETFPMIKSFICCVASGLSLIAGGKREHCYALFELNANSSWDFSLAGNKCTGSTSWRLHFAGVRCTHGRGWNWVVSEVPSNPDHFVILRELPREAFPS